MFAFHLGGCDVVLGAQWMRTLGPILWDFAELSLEEIWGLKWAL